MANGGLRGRLGLLFAALSGVGAASLAGELLRALPQAAALATDGSLILVAGPACLGAGVAVAHVFWLRSLRGGTRRRMVEPAPKRTLVPPPDDDQGGDKPPRWQPVIRN